MKKAIWYYGIIWSILFALFHVLAFIPFSWLGENKYSAMFWIGYTLIAIVFVIQFVCSFVTFRQDTKRMFSHLSLLSVGFSSLVGSFIVGGLCMILPFVPYWLGIVVCLVFLAFYGIAIVKSVAAIEIVTEIDRKIAQKTSFIMTMTAKAEMELSKAKSGSARLEAKKIYEALRYSDPMSNDSLIETEDELSEALNKFFAAMETGDESQIHENANHCLNLIHERNILCKKGK